MAPEPNRRTRAGDGRKRNGGMLDPAMRLLEALASAFINTFGITQPSDTARRRAAWFILFLLIAMVVVVLLIGLAFFRVLHA